MIFGGIATAQVPIDPGQGVLSRQTVATAIAGQPLGVAHVRIPLAFSEPAGTSPRRLVADDDGRVLYQVSRELQIEGRLARQVDPAGGPLLGGGRLFRRLGDLVREIGNDPPSETVAHDIFFLFTGDAPIRLRLSSPDAAGRTELMITPVRQVPQEAGRVGWARSPAYDAALTQWWSVYCHSMMDQMQRGDYPPLIESYLIAMLSGRLGLPLPAGFLPGSGAEEASMVSTLKLIAATDSVRTAIFRHTAVAGAEPPMPADRPLPESPRWGPGGSLAGLKGGLAGAAFTDQPEPEIEPLATRVPPECFYIRYGSFQNYLWFLDLSQEYGGDLSRMATVRGINDGSAKRMEDQLSLKTNQLSRMMGDSVIADQAIVGRDLFLSDGASLGVIFLARNGFLLKTSLSNDRTSLASARPDVTLTTETIEGREVSLLSSIDNRVRSFLIADGDFILVCNNREMVKRFIEVGRSGDSLGNTPEFRLARRLMPTSRDDTIFGYFSKEMMRGLLSPAYLIEMRRRLQSAADMALLRMARLASEAEGAPLWQLEELSASGHLPPDFGRRADGSGVIVIGDDLLDSMRGRAGTLLPIADVRVDAVTEEESVWYRQIAEYYSTRWREIDPIMFGLKRSSVPDAPGLERLEAHGEIAPLVPEKYGKIARQLGAPTRVKIEFAPDDIVAGQAHVVSDQLGGSIPPHHLFAAIKDTVPPHPDQFNGILKTYGALQSVPGYLGAWPFPGLIDRLPLGLGRGQPVGPGLSRLIGGLYRYQGGGFSIVSFQSDVMMASLPFLSAVEGDDDAQVRLRVGNLSGSQLETWVNSQLYAQAAKSSRGGADLLALLTHQWNVPPDTAADVAETILGGRLQDPLGGRYELAGLTGIAEASGGGVGADDRLSLRWRSTAWGDGGWSDSAPPEYRAPVLTWFRGGRANLTQYADRLVVDAVVDLQRLPAAGGR